MLFNNRRCSKAAWLVCGSRRSRRPAPWSLGTLAGLVLARFGPLPRAHTVLGMVTAPLVMPEVITGLSLLLLFVALAQLPIGWPDSAASSPSRSRTSRFTLAYVAVVVQSRLSTMDESLEEAAMDLGARPAKVFFVITLPIIAPALVSGWLLAFTLSLGRSGHRELPAGPSTSTLPMMIFSKVRLGVTPEINALATIMVTTVTVFVVVRHVDGAAGKNAQARHADGRTRTSSVANRAAGLDVGGSSIKAGVVDVGHGELAGEIRPFPRPSFHSGRHHEGDGGSRGEAALQRPGRLRFPVVVTHGQARTAANVDVSWIGVDAVGADRANRSAARRSCSTMPMPRALRK